MAKNMMSKAACPAKLIRDAAWVDAQLNIFVKEIISGAALDLIVIAGIRRRGAELARRVCERARKASQIKIPYGALDITLYRDDVALRGPALHTQKQGTVLDAPIDNRIVYLIDDVMYTGRTIRAAMTELTDYGRPGSIRLFSLIDRGGRELPIQPDRVGEKLIVPAADRVEVRVKEVDGEEGVFVVVGGMRGFTISWAAAE
ncbi:MAG: bifunctional pyr operon transcriptional regulator/uracil phosphoribosyltransferase PyrR [Planctomycetota bacterium]